jgi:hypothetical protein
MSLASPVSDSTMQASRVQSEIALAVLRQLMQQQRQQGDALVAMMRASIPAAAPGHVDTYA